MLAEIFIRQAIEVRWNETKIEWRDEWDEDGAVRFYLRLASSNANLNHS